MSKSFEKSCSSCKKPIELSDKSGRWLPYNTDGTPHDCRNQTQTGTKKEETSRVYTGSSEVVAVLNEAIELMQTCRKMLDQKK